MTIAEISTIIGSCCGVVALLIQIIDSPNVMKKVDTMWNRFIARNFLPLVMLAAGLLIWWGVLFSDLTPLMVVTAALGGAFVAVGLASILISEAVLRLIDRLAARDADERKD